VEVSGAALMYVDPYGDINDAGHKVGGGSPVVYCSVLVLLCFAVLSG
jgi:hypothetical protein